MPASSIYDLAAAAFQDRPRPGLFLFSRRGGFRPVSSEQLSRRVANLAAGLLGYGLGPGDRVAILADDLADGWISELAVLACGGTCVPLAPRLPEETLLRVLGEAEVRLALVPPAEGLASLLSIRPELPSLELVLLYRDPGGDGPLPATLVETASSVGAERLARQPDLLERARVGVSGEDAAFICYDFRRSATPRGVRLSHENLRSAAMSLSAAVPLGPEDRLLCRLSQDLIAGRPWVYACLDRGASVALGDLAVPLVRQLAEARPTACLLEGRALAHLRGQLSTEACGGSAVRRWLMRWAEQVGAQSVAAGLAVGRLRVERSWRSRVADLLILRRLRRAVGGSLKFFVSVGPPLPEAEARLLCAVGLPVLEGWGIPEACGALCQNTPVDLRLGTVGRPIPGARVRIGGDGSVQARGPQVTRGYLGEAPGDGSAWLHTGQPGRLDEAGYLVLTRPDGPAAAGRPPG